MSQTAQCLYCGLAGHWQETCPDWIRDELTRLVAREKSRPLRHASLNAHQTTPGRVSLTIRGAA